MKQIFRKFKKLISATIVGSMLMSFMVSTTAHAATTQFNQLPGDQEFTVGRTQNSTSYSDPVQATPSDRVTVAVYYHNNSVDTPATNVTIKSVLDTTSSTQHIIDTTLSADNADPITDTVVNGQIVGSPNLTINLTQAAQISYVPGSTLWYPDLQGNPNEAGIHLPDGITTSAGINLGTIDACWSHSGYVLFDVAFSQQSQLQTDKWVAVFGGNNQWVKENTASAGDSLRYQILFGNNGNGTAKNAKIVDTLPAGVTYEAGSVSKRILDGNNNDQDILIPDSQLTISGQTITIPLGDVLPGQNNSGYIYLRVKVDPTLAVGTHTLVNNETLSADNTPSVSASATTTVVVTPNPVPDVKILKEVVNVTQGASRWVQENTAQPGDQLQYRLTIYNQGTAPADQVSVKDVLPQYVTYVPGSTKIYTTDPSSATALPDGITTGGVTVGTVQSGVPTGNRYITFDATVSQTVPAGTINLINTANVYMANVLKDTSTATTTVTSSTGLLVTKEIWNAANGQWVTHLDNVKPGDVITYRILVRNSGNATVTGIIAKDTLPQYVTYVAGSSREDSVEISDAWITNPTGLVLPNLVAGNFKEITFQVTVAACPPGGNTTVTNTVNVTADSISPKTATADFVVVAGPPTLPK